MKPQPAPEVPGNTEGVDVAVRMLLRASREAFVKQETTAGAEREEADEENVVKHL